MLFAKPPLTGTMLAVDETGVGRPVIDLLDTSRFRPTCVRLRLQVGTNRHRAEGMGWEVPKKSLVSTLKVLLQGRRMTVAKSLPFAAALVEELQNFQVKLTEAANETFARSCGGYHDDLVLAIMIAAWVGEHAPTGRLGCGWGRMRMWECEVAESRTRNSLRAGAEPTNRNELFAARILTAADDLQ